VRTCCLENFRLVREGFGESPDIFDPGIFFGAFEIFLVPLPIGPDIGSHYRDLNVGIFLPDTPGIFRGVHAADAGTVVSSFFFLPRPDTGDEDDRIRAFSIGQTPDFTAGRTVCSEHPLELQARDHVGVVEVAKGLLFRGIVGLIPCGDDDPGDLQVRFPLRFVPRDSARRAGIVAEAAVDAVFGIPDGDVGDRTGVRHVDRLPDTDTGIVPVIDLDRAGFGARPAPGAGRSVDIPRVRRQTNRIIECIPGNRRDLGHRVQNDHRVPLHPGHLRGEEAHRTVVRGKRRVELGHVAADRGFDLDQVNPDAVVRDRQCRLYSGNAGAYHRNIEPLHRPNPPVYVHTGGLLSSDPGAFTYILIWDTEEDKDGASPGSTCPIPAKRKIPPGTVHTMKKEDAAWERSRIVMIDR